MRVHSLVAPKYDHYSAMSGDGFKNLTVYRGKGGALLTPERKNFLKGAAFGVSVGPVVNAFLRHHARARGADAWQRLYNDPTLGGAEMGGGFTPKQKKALKGAAAAGAAMLAAAGAHAGRKMLNDRAALEAINTGGYRAGPAFDSLLEPRF